MEENEEAKLKPLEGEAALHLRILALEEENMKLKFQNDRLMAGLKASQERVMELKNLLAKLK